MSVSEPFIRRPIATSLLTIGFVLIGIISYIQLGVAALPSTDFPTIFINTSLPGASPETMASSVATPLERNLGTLAGVTEITSINGAGSSRIIVQFALDRQIEKAAIDVQSAISAAASSLPKDLPKLPSYFKANPNAMPIINIALTSDSLPGNVIYDYANSIVSQKLAQLDGVAQVNIAGSEATAVRVDVNPSALAAMGIGMQDVSAAIRRSTVDSPKGSIDGPDQSWTITADDQLTTAEGYRDIIVAWKNGAAIKLGDIANVTQSVANTRTQGLYNDQRAVNISVIRQPDANMISTVQRVKEVLPLLSHWLPPSIKIGVTQDQSAVVLQSIRDVQLTLVLTAFLVVMVIAVFLRRFWATVIPAITIPVSVVTTFSVMYLMGYTLNNFSLMAVLVAVGFVVDDAIVMIENIVRVIETGVPPFEAALRGSRQMGFTIISITASLLSALIPLIFTGGIPGRFFAQFGVTLSAAIVISAIVSLTLTPSLCGILLPADRAGEHHEGRLGLAISGFFDRLTALYGRALTRVLDYPRTMLLVTLATIIASGVIFVIVPKGFMPDQDLGTIRGSTEAAPDVSFQAMSALQLQAVELLLKDPAVDNLTSSVSVGGGGPFGSLGGNTGNLTINLKPIAVRKLSTEQVMNRMRESLRHLPGIDVYLDASSGFGAGARSGKSRYQYTLVGAVELPVLQKWADTLAAKMATMPEFTDVGTDQSKAGLQVYLQIDRETAARLGVTASDIDQALYSSFGQRQVAQWYGDLNQYKVVLEADPSVPQTPEALGEIFIPGKGQVPLKTLVKPTEGSTPVSLNHQGSLLAITVTYNTATGYSISQATDAIEQAVKEIALPGEITSGSAGEAFNARAATNSMPLLLLAAIGSVYIVLGMLYESFAHPLTILSTIPSAAFGALVALLVTHTELSLVSLIGIILLIGIVKKNAILMVDFALAAQRTGGLSAHDAITRAAQARLRPILMTTFAAVLGAVPIAIGMGLGSEMRQPLGITMIGGLLFSQVLTLFSTPVVFLMVDRMIQPKKPRWLPIDTPAE